MKKLNVKRHFWLYAKEWYKKLNIVGDLKLIVSNYNWYENASKIDVAEFLMNIVQNNIIIRNMPAFSFSKFIEKLQPSERKYIGYNCTLEDWDYHLAVIYTCLHFMHFQDKVIFGELGTPDDKILPLSKNALNQQG